MLRWPDYSDYQGDVKTFYDDRNYEVAWTRDGEPTAAAMGFIEAFRGSGAKGLRPDDYDADRGGSGSPGCGARTRTQSRSSTWR